METSVYVFLQSNACISLLFSTANFILPQNLFNYITQNKDGFSSRKQIILILNKAVNFNVFKLNAVNFDSAYANISYCV